MKQGNLNGLGIVASGKRNIRTGNEYNSYFPKPSLSDPFLSYSGTTKDTINFMADIIKTTLADTKEISKVLKKSTTEATLRAIFDFVFKHLQYKPDSPTEEQLRRPSRSWADRKTGVDCDCYSIFIGSILSNLNIPFALRMVGINNKPYFQHVYVIVPKSLNADLTHKENYWVIDPVLDTFNEEHPFTSNYDLTMQPIRYLNGLSRETIDGLQGGYRRHRIGQPVLQKKMFYSPEAARIQEDAVFFDGLNFYERVEGIQGLGNLNGLGFLTKIWSGIKKGASAIKNVAKKVVFKADGTKRKLFNLRNKPQEVSTESTERVSDLTPIQPIDPTVQQVSQPVSTSQPATNSISDTLNLLKSTDKSLGIDSILNLTKNLVNPDMNQRLLEAEVKANKGLSTEEARRIAEDTAKAQKSDITKDILDQIDRVKTAGFGGMNVQTMLMVGLAIGAVYMFASRRPYPQPAL